MTGLAVAMLLLIGGCGGSADLAPAADASPALGQRNAAVAEDNGIIIVAGTPLWPGIHSIASRVTPMRLSIRNGTTHPLEVRRSAFVAVADGSRHAALDPASIGGHVVGPPRFVGAHLYRNERLVRDGFTPLYPPDSMPPLVVPAPVEAEVYDAYTTYEMKSALPTAAMRRFALPDGVLAPGGMVEGWVFFAPVSSGAERVVLHADLGHVRPGATAASLRIPFAVVNDRPLAPTPAPHVAAGNAREAPMGTVDQLLRRGPAGSGLSQPDGQPGVQREGQPDG